MIKKLFLLLLFSFTLFASQMHYEAKIYNIILSALFPNKQTIYVWSDTDEKHHIMQHLPNVQITDEIYKADLILLHNNMHIFSEKMTFVTSYKLLKRYQNSAIGGFYWKKGRPNILFLEKNLKKHHISLPPSLDEYIKNEL